jgi:hypothetical protein
MKRNKAAQRWLKKRKRAVKGGLSKLISIGSPVQADKSSLLPSPTVANQASDNSGILRQDHNQFRLPNALAEAGELEPSGWMPSRFVILVVVFALIFIGIIAWQVSEMPSAK